MRGSRWRETLAGAAAAAALLGLGALDVDATAQQQRSSGSALLKVTDLPSGFRPVGELAGRGLFYALNGAQPRPDDHGSHHTGAATTAAWAAAVRTGDTGHGTHGVLYRAENGVITGAGYLIRQADLVAGKSFRNVSLRGVPLPSAHALTIDFIPGATPDLGLYLWLWHLVPESGAARPMLPYGELPSLKALPDRFAVTGIDVHPGAFYPRMGRHRRDPAGSGRRTPTSVGDESVNYGEAAGKLVFIEYVFSHADFAAGVSWPAMPLNGVPIPPIDNLHIMHYEAAGGQSAYFTAHMYFVPERTYLSWETEPASVGASR